MMSLLLDLPLPFKKSCDGYLVELQALNGLKRWSEHFDKVTVVAPVLNDSVNTQASSILWADPKDLLKTHNVVLHPLPVGYHPLEFIKYKSEVYKTLLNLIDDHQYLCFSSLGGIGSWGNIGVDIAIKKNRKYALWFDWVLEQMPTEKNNSVLRYLKKTIDSKYAKHKIYHAINKCDLGLFHGKTVYDAYSPYCKNPQLVHDIHLSESDAITEINLIEKLKSVEARSNIKIGYVGRVHPMKAPDDWIAIVSNLINNIGADKVQAIWLGDGPLLNDSIQQIRKQELSHSIEFKGFIGDRGEILRFLQDIDIFLFCHVTPESPRCLIEALISGTAIVGYESAYAVGVSR